MAKGVDESIANHALLHKITLVAIVLLLVRVIMATSVHPRTALITKTLKTAANDFLHFGTLAVIVFLGFTFIGSIWFGAQKQEMAFFVSTAALLFDSLLGPPDKLEMSNSENGLPSFEMHLFILLWHCVGFFIILNFVLTIIIHAYDKVNEEIENNETEQDIFSDMFVMVEKWWNVRRFRWPSDERILDHLQSTLRSKYVTAEQLLWDKKSVFTSEDQLQSFIDFYKGFEFCIADEDKIHKNPDIQDVATFQCLMLQKLEQLARSTKQGQQTSQKLLRSVSAIVEEQIEGADAEGDATVTKI